jgi:uncharacterized phage protein gp47/JayE
MAGLTPTGFVIKTLEEIRSELSEDQKTALGPELNTSDQALAGVFTGVVSDQLAQLWELAQAVHASAYPDSASGVSLDGVLSITGAERLDATQTAVLLRCTGTPGTVLPAGRVASTAVAGDRFASTIGAVIGGGGFVDVAFLAESTGPVLANVGTVTQIETPVAGWASVTNLAAGVLGRNEETDAEARQRRLLLLARQGDATVDAIRSQVLAVAGVNEAFVFENTTLVTAGGIPGKAVEVVVQGGANADVARAIFESKAAGIEAFGSTIVNVTDSQGFGHDIGFTRPTELRLVMTLDVDVVQADWPTDGDVQLKQNLSDAVNALFIGQDVVLTRLFYQFFKISGAQNFVQFQIGVFPALPTSSDVVVDAREVATLDPGDISLVINFVDPT